MEALVNSDFGCAQLERVVGAASVLMSDEMSPADAVAAALRRGSRRSRVSRASNDRDVEAAVSLSGLAAEHSSVQFVPTPVYAAPSAPGFQAPATAAVPPSTPVPAPAPPPPAPPPAPPLPLAPASSPTPPPTYSAPHSTSSIAPAAYDRRAYLANLPRPRWYDVPLSAAPNQNLDSLRPVSWETIIREALGQPITSSAATCSITADSMRDSIAWLICSFSFFRGTTCSSVARDCNCASFWAVVIANGVEGLVDGLFFLVEQV
ncbi:hypothetical protein AB1Y20_009257 [Prymnesium parvum]|uniref:Uncharacterized protein n=1 Tax=Prymnesium parvum TaxID=97485 RepID=A0AB34K4J6_PRYPA